MVNVERVAMICASPLAMAVWASYLLGCPEIREAGCYPNVLAFLAAGEGSCDVLLVISGRLTKINKWPRFLSALRVVCIGAKSRGMPKNTTWIPEDASPSLLFDTLRGERGCAHRKNIVRCATAKPLTEREQEILLGICNGLPLKDIAAKGKQSVSTIETQLHRVMKKMAVTTRAALILKSAAMGLTECPCRRSRS